MRFQRQIAFISALQDLFQDGFHISVSHAGGHYFSGAFVCVFDVDVGNVRLQHLIGLQGILPALYKVCEVKDSLEILAGEFFQKLQAAESHVSIDFLFIFVEKHHLLLPGIICKLFHPPEYFVFVLRRIFPLRDKETEDTDIGRFHDLRDLYRLFE